MIQRQTAETTRMTCSERHLRYHLDRLFEETDRSIRERRSRTDLAVREVVERVKESKRDA